MNAASNGDLEVVQLLIAKGAKVNAVSGKDFEKTKNGALELGFFTPLLLASTYGPPALVRALLDAKADVNAKDVRGMTPLMYAVTSEHQNPEIVQMLLAAGADRTAKDNKGTSADDWALKFRRPETLKVLNLSAPPLSSETGEGHADLSKSIALLQKSSPTFFSNGGGCVACHHQGSTFVTVGLARDRGFAVDETAAATEVKTTHALWLGLTEMSLQRLDPPGGEDVDCSALRFGVDACSSGQSYGLACFQSRQRCRSRTAPGPLRVSHDRLLPTARS